jgi:mRNA interferase MazF
MKRGEIVIIDFPFSDQSGRKRRPALVVQADGLNQSLRDTILASISTTAKGDVTHVLIDPHTEPSSGLKVASGVRCEKLFVIEQRFIRGSIGELSSKTMSKVDAGLRKALGL